MLHCQAFCPSSEVLMLLFECLSRNGSKGIENTRIKPGDSRTKVFLTIKNRK
jgi:hypothetical protein